jgi:hypothetical protein
MAAGPAFEPVKLQRINLPSRIKEASTPVFTLDGQHLLFFSGLHLWIAGENGRGLSCLSCGLSNEPTLSATEQEGFATEFPDRRRVFFGAAGSVSVLECRPSVVRCSTRRILPIDLSAARPGGALVPPGGAVTSPALDQASASSPKLAPDGMHVAFSDIRTDAVELMVIAKLARTATKYVLSDPRVINPPGPSSKTDLNTRAWSDSSGLFEFKSFADGGAAATYAQVGGDALGNPDVWQINLATGRRTRLTSYPDWDEDDAPSPDGRSIVIESDRTMHRVDMLGALMPVRDFIDAPEVAVLASYFVGGAVQRQCDLQPWLLPASGDRGANLLGQPLQPYTGGSVHGANNVSGYPQWSPDGTRIALNTESYRTNRSAPYLLVAHLISRRPRPADRIVSSQPGGWAPGPLAYHGPIGAVARVVLPGLSSGTAAVNYDNTGGLLSGADSVTYDRYSDNGRDFVSGTFTITNTSILNGPIDVDANLRMTGADSGYIRVQLKFSGIGTLPVTVSGTASSNYDGTTITGIPPAPRSCPGALPRPPHMRVAARLSGSGARRALEVHVTATIRGAGANERRLDTRPVTDAIIRLGGVTARTDAAGRARIIVPPLARGRAKLTATAGDTLAPAATFVNLGR